MKAYYMPLYFDDFVGGTYAMSPAARGVYIMVLIALAKGDRVRADHDAVRRIGGEHTLEQFAEILQKCKTVDGYLVNDKVARVMELIAAKRVAGKASASHQHNASRTVNTTEAECSTEPQQNGQQNGDILNPNILNPKAQSPKPKTQNHTSVDSESTPMQSYIRWDRSDGWIGITDDEHDKWAVAYTPVSTVVEFGKMHQWLLSNPAKARKKNWRKFITGWFARALESQSAANRFRPPVESNF